MANPEVGRRRDWGGMGWALVLLRVRVGVLGFWRVGWRHKVGLCAGARDVGSMWTAAIYSDQDIAR
jgi:hypothetical protein